jgi:hypothetical protein
VIILSENKNINVYVSSYNKFFILLKLKYHLRRLITGFLPQSSGFITRAHVGFVVDEVALEQVFL